MSSTSAATRPVSLGLPVFNGQRYLAITLDGLLSQTFADFELVICDNASTDSTEEICRQFARQDHRVRYYRAEENQGVVWNFNRAFELSNGEYFKWVAHDDFIAPTFLQTCVSLLDNDPKTALAMTDTVVIDDQGRRVIGDDASGFQLSNGEPLTDHNTPGRRERLASISPAERFRAVLIESRRCYEIFGLIRANALRRTRRYMAFPNAEKVLLAELSLRGKFLTTPDALFFSRWHEDRFTNNAAPEKRNQHWNPNASSRIVWPHQPRCAWHYWCTPWRHPLSLRERLACTSVFASFVASRERWSRLAKSAFRGTGMTVKIPPGCRRGQVPVELQATTPAESLLS